MKITNITRKFTAVTLLAMTMAFGSVSALAVHIDGAITMSGDFAPTGGTGADLSDATGMDFLGDDFQVDGVTGDLATFVSVGDVGFYQDFTFSPLAAPVDPLWAVGGFEFALGAVSVDFQNATFIILSGTGIISGNGFDPTTGTWNLTGNNSGMLFNFSAGSLAVPEPGSLSLLGLGLIGFAVLRRRTK